MWVRVWLAGAWLVGACLVGACLVGACLAGVLSACSVIDPVDSRYDTISRSLAKARNESIFLNLIRASHDYPLSFVTVANVTPTMTNTSSLGLPSFLFGPLNPGAMALFTPGRDVIFGNTTASNSTAVGTNFNVSTQETSTFYGGFLKPIDLQVLDYFIRQGYSRELLFWLFTDSVEITFQGNTSGTRYNPPEDYGCIRGDPRRRCFKEFVLIAIAAGVTVEEQTLQKSGGASGAGGPEKTAGGGGGSKPTTQVFSRFCFNPVFAERAKQSMGEALYYQVTHKYADLPPSQFQPKCGDPKWDPVQDAEKPQPDSFNFNVGGRINFKIIPRSAYGVFEFLGTLIRMQRDKPAPSATAFIPSERVEEQLQLPMLRTVPPDDDPYLMQVTPANGDSRCFVRSWFYDGDYCVPESATNTKRIFSLLAQLIAIQTAATDLSITPVVRVIQ
jgi:hypothetical protein